MMRSRAYRVGVARSTGYEIMISRAFILVVAIAAISCEGGSSGVGASSGIPRSKTFGELSEGELATHCDWLAKRQGGYGRSETCPDGSEQTTNTDQKDCTAGAAFVAIYCPDLTVGDADDCVNEVLTDLCKFDTAAGCVNVKRCLDKASSP